MKIVNIHEAKSQLSRLIQEVLNGERIVIAKNNEPVAELKPFTNSGKRWGYGILRGKIQMKGDWHETDKELEDLLLGSNPKPDE